MSADAPEADEPNLLIAGRREDEILREFFDWAIGMFDHHPQGLEREDAVYLAGVVLSWILIARHAKPGGIRSETMIALSCIAVLHMSWVKPQDFRSAKAAKIWRRYLDWYLEIWPGDDSVKDPHAATVKAEFDRATTTVLRGILWTGDLAKGYAEAANLYARGKWPEVMRKARSTGVTYGLKDDEQREVLVALESMRETHEHPLTRRASGQVLPSFGPALDILKNDKPKQPKTPRPRAPLPFGEPVAPDPLADLRAQRNYREFTQFRAFVEGFTTRNCRSRYAPIVSENAWRLLTNATNPESLAKELGLSPRVMRREWDAHVQRLERDPRWGAAVQRVRAL